MPPPRHCPLRPAASRPSLSAPSSVTRAIAAWGVEDAAVPPRAAGALALACIVLASACGGEAEPPAADSAEIEVDVADTGGGCSLPGSSAQEGPAPQSEDFQVEVQHLAGSAKVKGSLAVPGSCQNAKPCPLIVVVGDRGTSPLPQLVPGAEALARSTGAAVAVFNLPGTGVGGHASGGQDDFGGDLQLSAVKEVMRLLSERSYIDKQNSGYLTIGWGLVPAAAALAKFSASSLGFVRFLIDVEGPSDRCAASQAPANPAKSIGPDDGPGATETACNFGAGASHAAAYPPGGGDIPASILCAPGAWPITETGKDCTDTSWWSAREPARALKSSAIQIRYQRVQFAHDHRAPSAHAARVMMQALAASKSRFFALNDMPPCEVALTDAVCSDLRDACQRCWLEATYGNGMAPAPYAGAALQEVTPQELFADALPRFVRRMIDPLQSANCR